MLCIAWLGHRSISFLTSLLMSSAIRYEVWILIILWHARFSYGEQIARFSQQKSGCYHPPVLTAYHASHQVVKSFLLHSYCMGAWSHGLAVIGILLKLCSQLMFSLSALVRYPHIFIYSKVNKPRVCRSRTKADPYSCWTTSQISLAVIKVRFPPLKNDI